MLKWLENLCAGQFIDIVLKHLLLLIKLCCPGVLWEPIRETSPHVTWHRTHAQSAQLTEPLWTDHSLKSGIAVCKLISTLKKKDKGAGTEWVIESSLRALASEEKAIITIMRNSAAVFLLFVFRLKYPRRRKLYYLYPPPSPSILANISNALAACPKFYVQVHVWRLCCGFFLLCSSLFTLWICILYSK